MQMEFTLKNTHAKGSEIKDFLEDKTSKLNKYFDGKLHARWTIVYEQDEHESHLHVTGNNLDYIGKSRDHNLFTSIEGAVEKVDRQLSRHKEMVQDHHSK
jgi:putative sigma-54 modulation protein